MRPMPIDAPMRCPQGFTAEQLSTWRAQGLDAAEAERLGAHLPACAVCQARLAAYDEVGAALRGQPVPAANGAIWEALEPRLGWGSLGWHRLPLVVALRSAARSSIRDRRIAGAQRHVSPPAASSTPGGVRPSRPVRVLATVAAIAALLLVVAGFASMLHQRAALAPLSLSWQRVTIPPDIAATYLQTVTMQGQLPPPAPSDGNTAYGCVIPTALSTPPSTSSYPPLVPPHVRVTHDRGARWTQLADLPIGREDITDCTIVVDSTNPTIAIATVQWPVNDNPRLGDPTAAAFATRDGGKTWQTMTDERVLGLGQIASWHDVTYATTGWDVLFASHDGLRTWQSVNTPLPSSGARTLRFWLRSDSGELLAVVRDYTHDRSSVWVSADGGEHWAQVQAPDDLGFEVQHPIVGQPWRLCGSHYPGHNPSNALDCTWDGGKTWNAYQLPVPSLGANLIAITPSGDLLLESGQSGQSAVYVMRAGTQQWQELSLPATGSLAVSYSTGPHAGVLWAYSLDFPAPNRPGMLKAIYVADYPAV